MTEPGALDIGHFVYMCICVFVGKGDPVALKDLVASKASLAEEVIEQIISDYVRFDPDQKEIVFTPESGQLSNKARVLVYLVALQGWPFIIDEIVPVDAKPAEIEAQTGIPGGTLRPTLKELKDRNVIAEKGGRYFVRAAALRTIEAELKTNSPSSPTSRSRRRIRRASQTVEEPQHDDGPSEKKKPRKASGSVTERFQAWIGEGYFDKPRTLSDVQKRFHKEAIIVPQTSLPYILLKAVRSGQLSRDKADVDGKNVWAYGRKK